MQKRGLLTEAATVVGGGVAGGVVCRYVSAIVMFCLRELTEAATTISKQMKSQSKLLSPLAERAREHNLRLCGGDVGLLSSHGQQNALATPKDAQDMSELTKLVREWSAR